MSNPQTTERWWDDAERDPIHAAAADWFARLQDSEVSVEETLDWQSWMHADPKHAEAFRRLEETWEHLGSVSPARVEAERRALARDASSYDGSMSLAEWHERRSSGSPHPYPLPQAGEGERPLPLSPGRGGEGSGEGVETSARSRMKFAIAASMLVTSLGLGWVVLDGRHVSWDGLFPRGVRAEIVQTAVGENRSVRLMDGTQVTLGGNTQVEVAFDEKTRQVELSRGEAYFSVARDSARPFVVHAGDAKVVAVGTAFNVRRGNDRVVVAVVEGRVTVEQAPPSTPIAWLRERAAAGQQESKREPLPLNAGEQTTVGVEGIAAAIPLASPATAVAWRNGLLSFQREPLRYVLEDVNRYSPKPVVIEDESIGQLRITGTVINNDVGDWIASLEKAFELRAVEEPDRIVLTRAN